VRAYLDEFRRMYPGRAGSSQVRVFGMVEGSASHSDYELVRAGLHPQVKHYIRSVAVDPKDRINAVNLALRDPDGEIGAQIDPLCESVVRDLQASRNAPSSFRMEKEAGLGHYAQAWSAKLLWAYPIILETKRAHSSWSHSRPESTPEARLSQGRLNRAVRDGRVTKPKACEECQAVGYVEGAHFNYNPEEALRVRWLCRRCHLAWDLAEPKHGTKKG
jgi:hypothetical protein